MTCMFLIPAKYVLGATLSTHGGSYQSSFSFPIVFMFSTLPLYQVASPISLEGES